MDERYDIIRTVRDTQYRYIRNFEPLKPYYQYMNTPEKGATMQEIRKKEASGQLDPVMALFSAKEKPVEELYDTHADPSEIHNLVDNPAFSQRLGEMRHALSEWQNEIGDIGLIPEAEIEILEQNAGSRFEILHGTPGDSPVENRLATLVDIATSASEGPAPAFRSFLVPFKTRTHRYGTGQRRALGILVPQLRAPAHVSQNASMTHHRVYALQQQEQLPNLALPKRHYRSLRPS